MINLNNYDTDKSQQYIDNYYAFFKSLSEKNIFLLELGIKNGGSLLMWKDFFRRGTIVGLDINPVTLEDESNRIRIHRGLQHDIRLLDVIRNENAPEGFDIIIDDCSHIGGISSMSFWHLFDKHLKPKGIYVIEDWGTGYWNKYPDGRRYRTGLTNFRYNLFEKAQKKLIALHNRAENSPQIRKILNLLMSRLVPNKFKNHSYGLVGFIKTLVDECGRSDITHPDFGKPPHYLSKFNKIQINHGQVFIVKA